MLARDPLQLLDQPTSQPDPAVGGGDVHALDLGDLGLEVADASERRRLAADSRQQEDSAWRDQVGGRPGGDFRIDVDEVGPEGAVGLADEVGVERGDAGIVGGDGAELDAHARSTGSPYSIQVVFSAPVVS